MEQKAFHGEALRGSAAACRTTVLFRQLELGGCNLHLILDGVQCSCFDPDYHFSFLSCGYCAFGLPNRLGKTTALGVAPLTVRHRMRARDDQSGRVGLGVRLCWKSLLWDRGKLIVSYSSEPTDIRLTMLTKFHV